MNTLTYPNAETAADNLSDVAAAMTATTKARLRLQDAEANLRRVKDAQYCCTASQNQALGAAKKQVKRWTDSLADAEALRSDEPEQRGLFDDEEDDGPDEWSIDEQRSMDRYVSEQDGS